jgi:hypothetical protein
MCGILYVTGVVCVFFEMLGDIYIEVDTLMTVWVGYFRKSDAQG